MTSLLEYLAVNGDATMTVSFVAPQTIVEAFCTSNLVYLSLHLSVFGWHVNVHPLIHWNVHLIV